MTGFISRTPGAAPGIEGLPEYDIVDIDEQLARFTDIEVWFDLERGNWTRTGKHLRVTARQGGLITYTSDDGIVVGTGMRDPLSGEVDADVPTLNFPGGATTSPELPPHIPGFEVTGAYFFALVVRFPADVVFDNTPMRLFTCGPNGGTDIEIFIQNNAVIQRHVTAQNTSTVGQFTPGNTYIIWAGFSPQLQIGRVGINSVTPVAWASELLAGSSGAGQPLQIGSAFNATASGGVQMLKGHVPAWFAGRIDWLQPDKQALLAEWLRLVALKYHVTVTA